MTEPKKKILIVEDDNDINNLMKTTRNFCCFMEADILFISNGDKSEMPANAVVSSTTAIECAKQFYETQEKPDCIEWREL